MSNKVVIPKSVPLNEDIIQHLTEILDSLNFSTKTCICCEWVDYEGEKWRSCSRCFQDICETCYDQNYDDHEGSMDIICVYCDETLKDN